MEQFYQDKNFKIAIVGAGPAGIYCALNLLDLFKKNNFQNYNLTIFDRSQALRTILPTGGTRCNITNSCYDLEEFISNYPRGQKFLESIFSRYFNYDAIDFFKTIGIDTYIQDDNRVFPISNSSKDVKDKMLNALKKYNNVQLVHKEINSKNDLKEFDRVILASGSRFSSKLIKSYNQPMIDFRSSLTGLIVDNFNYPVGVSVKSLDGDFIFTSDGISGPLAYKISSINIDKKMPYELKIRLFDVNDLIDLISKNTKKSIGSLVSKLIPKSLAKFILVDFDTKASEISKKRMIEISELNLKIIAKSKLGEIVNAGGVDLKFIDKNCKSKIIDNLWFCGEILDIDGFCGGYNLQNCWSTGYIVAKDVFKSILKQ